MSRRLPRGGKVRRLWGTDDTKSTILHVDMDAFFVAVELRDRPECRGKPVVVGMRGKRSVVTAASYEAREYGVFSAMPMSVALRRCPHAIVIEPTPNKYGAVSSAVMDIFREITPLVEQVSVDEAFLDVAGAVRRLGSPSWIGRMIRERVHQQEGLTCTVGISVNKFVAKLASQEAKPDGLLLVAHDQVVDFVHSLPVEAMWGVGEKSAAALRRWGITTVRQIADAELADLQKAVGVANGQHLYELSWGRDPRPVETHHEEKSIGVERTFQVDVSDRQAIHNTVLYLAHKTAARVRKAGLVGKTITVKLRWGDFTTVTRSRTLAQPTDVAVDLVAASAEIIDVLMSQNPAIRLIGIRLEGLTQAGTTPVQLTLNESKEPNRRDAELILDDVHGRFGADALTPASLLRRQPAFPKRNSELL